MLKQDKHIIVGGGEVGTALSKILECLIHDPFKGVEVQGKFDVLHVAFPYSTKFVSEVRKYEKIFKTKLTIIHSTVPIGTTEKLNAVHSPIRGVHPYLEKGIRTFIKFFGGKKAKKAAAIFAKLGLKTRVVNDSKTTEAAKLWDTTQYGLMILINKEINSWCKSNKVDFDIVYKEFNETYNDGYAKLGRKEVNRPILKHMPGSIGGHCVIPNAKILNSWLAHTLLTYNENY